MQLRRPLYAFALVFFFTAVLLIGFGERYGLTVLVVTAPTFLIALLVPSLRRTQSIILLLLAVLLAATTVYTRHVAMVEPLERLGNTTCVSTLRITALPEGNSTMYRATVVKSDTLPRGTRLSVSVLDPEVLCERYDEVSGELSLYSLPAAQKHLRGDDVFLMGRFEGKVQVRNGSGSFMETAVSAVRNGMLQNMRTHLPDARGDLLAGVCLGEVSSFSEDMQTDFRKSGLTHILVVSGLHMALLSAAIYKVMRLLKAGKGLTLCVTLLFLWVFMLMVGFSASVIRSSVMLHFLLIGQSLRIRADARTSLAVALLLIVLQNPYAVQDIGFLLSFASTLGMVVLTPLVHKAVEKIPFLYAHPYVKGGILAVCTPLIVMVFTAPILAYAFGALPILSPLANLLVGLPTTALLYLGMIGSVLLCIPGLSFVAQGVLLVAGGLAKWIMLVARVVAGTPGAQFKIGHTVVLLLLFVIPVLLYWSYKLLKKRGLIRAGIASVAMVAVCCSMLFVFSKKMTFIRVFSRENAFAMTIQSGERTVVLMSGDDHYGYITAGRFLLSCGIDTVDALVVLDGKFEMTASLARLTEMVSVDTMIYPKSKPDMTAGIADIQRVQIDGAMDLTVKGVRLERQGAWWRLTIGDTRLLLSLEYGTVRSLSEDWRLAHLAIYMDEVPEMVSSLTVQRAIMVCTPQRVRYVTGELPWGRYPIDLAAQHEKLTLCTTGEGNVLTADGYFL